MVSRAIAKHVRISARKVRLVIDLIRGKKLADAQRLLAGVKKQARQNVQKLLNSAVSNAKQVQPGIADNDLYISKATADEGPMMRRFQARAMGRATTIRKKSCHITLELDRIKNNGE